MPLPALGATGVMLLHAGLELDGCRIARSFFATCPRRGRYYDLKDLTALGGQEEISVVIRVSGVSHGLSPLAGRIYGPRFSPVGVRRREVDLAGTKARCSWVLRIRPKNGG